ncbi:MAG: hypothetical protein DHS20C17_00870 [Cyclobacteriaceae bacterium]|nr:MAG: hypothetical protein DHS20C17_00870 [Cyclobacteriaceae bacterium]
MKVVIIGGTGHIGTYLVPRLVNAGHETIVVSRNKKHPYLPHSSWNSVRHVEMDRVEMEKDNLFATQILTLAPDVVIDLICYTPESARNLVEVFQGKIAHLISCGTIWVHGYSEQVPTKETQPRNPFCQYGKNKAACEEYLLSVSRDTGFPVTILHPGHLVGQGWKPLNPAGNFNLVTFKRIARGEEVILPNLGLETVHHVHADDVAQSFIKAMDNRSKAIGESFHIVSEQALTLRGYAIAMAAWFGQKPLLKFLPWESWKNTVEKDDANATWDHIAHSPNCSIAKAQKLLHYSPRYSSLESIYESIQYLIDNNQLDITN